MSWIPGFSTVDLGSLYRFGNSWLSGLAIRTYNKNLQNRTGYTQQNYRGGDIITPQTVALAKISQRTTIEKMNVSSTPTLQIGDLINREG